MHFSSTPAYSFGLKPPAARTATEDVGPGQYYKDPGVGTELGITIPKGGRGAFFQEADNTVGPGQYNTNTSSINIHNGITFKGHSAALELA